MREQPVHLLVADVVMPLMRGTELADCAQAIRASIKVLLVSGYQTSDRPLGPPVPRQAFQHPDPGQCGPRSASTHVRAARQSQWPHAAGFDAAGNFLPGHLYRVAQPTLMERVQRKPFESLAHRVLMRGKHHPTSQLNGGRRGTKGSHRR